MLKFLLFTCALFSSFSLASAADPHTQSWLELSVHSQNVGYRIHMFGVDADEPNPKNFEKDIFIKFLSKTFSTNIHLTPKLLHS